jgi:hypothetical protein
MRKSKVINLKLLPWSVVDSGSINKKVKEKFLIDWMVRKGNFKVLWLRSK